MRLICKIEMYTYQSKASLEENILSGKIPHHLDTGIRQMLEKSIFGNEDSTFHYGS